MSDACQYLHEQLSRLPRLGQEDLVRVPPNGVYVVFETGEEGHNGERIVRVGTHTGPNNLPSRIREHLYKQNKDRSIFRKHVGRCLLAKASDPFLSQWEIDLTTLQTREANAHRIDMVRLREVERIVSDYMTTHFSFSVLPFDTLADRLHIEAAFLSTIFTCSDCGPSTTWLGRFHPNSATIRQCGLWNIRSLTGTALKLDEAKRIIPTSHSMTH